MAKYVVIFVHGMGVFPDDHWADAAHKTLTDAFNAYDKPRSFNFADRFDLRAVSYDRVFESWRQQWAQDAAKFAQAMTANGLSSGAAQALLQAAQATGGNALWQTHLLDVALFRYFPQVRTEVLETVSEQVLSIARPDNTTDFPRYSIVCHSLGTAVVFQALLGLINSGQLPTSFRPVNVFAIANVARLLWPDGSEPYQPELAPHQRDDQGMCTGLACFGHALDPFVQWRPFDPPPPGWLPADAPADEIYFGGQLAAGDIQQADVHALTHYLSHPDVHAPLIRMLGDRLPDSGDIIPRSEQVAQAKLWRQARLGDSLRRAAQDRLGALVADRIQEATASTALNALIQRLAGL